MVKAERIWRTVFSGGLIALLIVNVVVHAAGDLLERCSKGMDKVKEKQAIVV